MTYWTLNALFLAAAAALVIAARVLRRRPHLLPLVVTVLVLFVTSAVFDNVMIGIGLVGYNRDLISGAFLGIAPLEDFAYVFGAVLLLPALWHLLPARRRGLAARDVSGERSDRAILFDDRGGDRNGGRRSGGAADNRGGAGS